RWYGFPGGLQPRPRAPRAAAAAGGSKSRDRALQAGADGRHPEHARPCERSREARGAHARSGAARATHPAGRTFLEVLEAREHARDDAVAARAGEAEGVLAREVDL